MKKILATWLLIIAALGALAQKGNQVLGKWADQDGRGQVEIYKKSNKYYGKIAWLKTPYDKKGKPLTDRQNLIPSQRSRQILGLEILKSCIFNGSEYEDGSIYDPLSGKTYTCTMKLRGNILKVSGYIGMFLVRTVSWKRVK